jgi:NTE family protein
LEEHWNAGYNDAVTTLHHPEMLQRPKGAEGVFTFDFTE